MVCGCGGWVNPASVVIIGDYEDGVGRVVTGSPERGFPVSFSEGRREPLVSVPRTIGDVRVRPSVAGGTEGATQAEGSGNPSVSVRSLLVLAGTVRETPLDRAIGMSPLRLPVGSGRTVMDVWATRGSQLRGVWPGMTMRVVGKPGELAGVKCAGTGSGGGTPDWVRIEEDPRPYRGTAGLLRDLVSDYADDEYVLVVAGRRLVLSSMVPAAVAMGEEDVAVFAEGEEDTGVMGVRVGVIRRAREVGFEDFREQFLPRLAKEKEKVKAVRRDACGMRSRSIRRASDYLSAVRARVLEEAGGAVGADEEAWKPAFSLVEEGAEMGPGAMALDSVVMSGARVGEGATLGRCVVGPGGVVAAGARLLDVLVGARR